MAPHFILEQLNQDYKLVLVDRKSNAQKSKTYLALNPSGRIPTLLDNKTTICESAAICLYLGENNPKSKLVPIIGSPDRAEFLQWLMYLTNTLQVELMIYDYPEKYTKNKDNEIIITTQELRISEMWSLLDKALEGREFLIGQNITICDYYLFMLAVWSDELKQPPLSFRNISSYLCNLAKRNEITEVCRKENLSLNDYR
jgi:glutathione S-transferase